MWDTDNGKEQMKGDLGVERERETDDERQAMLVNTKLRPMIFIQT